jgi:hypothetical protein
VGIGRAAVADRQTNQTIPALDGRQSLNLPRPFGKVYPRKTAVRSALRRSKRITM